MTESVAFRPPRPLSVAQVAERINRSPRQVVRLIASGKLKAFRPGGGFAHWCIEVADLERFKAESCLSRNGCSDRT